MSKHFLMAYKFMKGYPLNLRLVFACHFMFKEKYRTMKKPFALDDVLFIGGYGDLVEAQETPRDE